MEEESLMDAILIACHSTQNNSKFLTFAKLQRDAKSRNEIYFSAHEVFSSFVQTDRI